jgi:hypothetical protein
MVIAQLIRHAHVRVVASLLERHQFNSPFNALPPSGSVNVHGIPVNRPIRAVFLLGCHYE